MVEDDRKNTDKSVERLMGNKPELRFEFIQERAEFAATAELRFEFIQERAEFAADDMLDV